MALLTVKCDSCETGTIVLRAKDISFKEEEQTYISTYECLCDTCGKSKEDYVLKQKMQKIQVKKENNP